MVITAKIKFGILLCCFPMRFLIFLFLMFSMMFAKTSLLFCYFCIRLFQPRCYYSCPYAVMRNLDAIIRVRMLLCETSMLLFVPVCCYAKPRCYYSCPYAVMRNLDAKVIIFRAIKFLNIFTRCKYFRVANRSQHPDSSLYSVATRCVFV